MIEARKLIERNLIIHNVVASYILSSSASGRSNWICTVSDAAQALEGVRMELIDAAYPLVKGKTLSKF